MKLQSTLCYIWLSVFMLSMHSQARASHFMGLSISYECFGTCNYRIYHKSYYDCLGAATTSLPTPPLAPVLGITSGPGCIAPAALASWQLVHYIEITPLCSTVPSVCLPNQPPGGIIGVNEAIFYRDYNFCNVNCTAYTITWGNCCRNAMISSGAAHEGMYLTASIDLSHTPCNSSPDFTDPPVHYICSGRTTTVQQGAFDVDGDSLSYALIGCRDNSIKLVRYNPGFSAQNPLGPSWAVSLDNLTGELTFTPNPSGNSVVGVMCVRVSEWRNGVSIGEVTRDIQVVVLNCPSGDQPVLDSITSLVNVIQTGPKAFETCVGNTVSITFEVSDPTLADSIVASTNIGNYFPGATISVSGRNPVQATLTFQATAAGNYAFRMAFDDDSCPVPNALNQLYNVVVGASTCLTAQITHTACGVAGGAIDITVPAMATSPLNYLWSNGATTEDITGLFAGQYTVNITDANGILFTNSFWVNDSNVHVSTIITQPDCSGPTGAIQSSVFGGGPPYTYLWNTGDTTADISGLEAGGYSLTVISSYGCRSHVARVLDQPDSCFNIIEGHVYDDINGNCIQEPGELGLAYAYVNFAPGGATFTDINGYYAYQVDTGDFRVSLPSNIYYDANCPTGAIDTVSFVGLGQRTTLDFAMDSLFVQDLVVSMISPPARSGRVRTTYLFARNAGTITMNGILRFTHDSTFDYINSIPAPDLYDSLTSTASWIFQNLSPSQVFRVRFFTEVDSMIPLGDPWSESAQVNPVIGDTTPTNNSSVFNDTIRGPYDPNYKAVSPKGVREPGYILAANDDMHYTVHFQNVGTDTAFYVVIRDTIDSDLEITTLRPGSESFPYSLIVEEDSILVFTFAHINLPDSGTNFLESQGHVSYYLKHNGSLPAGTVIQNSAAIYFDFNAPVITNTVRNTIYTQPAVGLGNDTTLCEGEVILGNITAAGMPPYNFVWSTGQNDLGNTSGQSQATVSNTGSYSVTVTDAYGFTTTDAVDVTVTPLSDASFTLFQSNLTYGFTGTGVGNTTWNWSFGDGNTASGSPAATHTYASKGVYTATLITTNDCGTDTISQVIDFSTALEEDAFSQTVKIQPNPFTSSTFVSFENAGLKPVAVNLYDLTGKQLRQYTTTSTQVEIQRESLSQGIYLLEIRAENAVYYGRVVVE